MPAGAARNALDCAFWDLAAKQAGRRAYELAGIAAPKPLTTAYTISLAAPAAMAEAAERAASRPLLKVKLGAGEGDEARIAAVRRAAPRAELIVDANEGWSETNLAQNLAACAEAGVTLIEQPLPEGRDTALAGHKRPIRVCADESIHDRRSLAALAGKYDAINIKLDKTGGLTEALALAAEAQRHGLTIMVGCMVATSLAMAPAMLVAQARECGRSRRPVAVGEGSRRRIALRRQPRLSARSGPVGVRAGVLSCVPNRRERGNQRPESRAVGRTSWRPGAALFLPWRRQALFHH